MLKAHEKHQQYFSVLLAWAGGSYYSLGVRQDNQNFNCFEMTLFTTYHFSSVNIKMQVKCDLMSFMNNNMVVFLKTIFQRAIRTRWQLSALQDYFLTNSEKRGGKVHFVVVTKASLCYCVSTYLMISQYFSSSMPLMCTLPI